MTLFYRAYQQAQQGTQETEQMARNTLANQFAVGLRHNNKVKVARAEGTFEQLLTKAKFKEAKPCTSSSIMLSNKRQLSLPRNERTVQSNNSINQKRYYNCNATGHLSRNCPVCGCAILAESHGRSNHNRSSRDTECKKVATIVSEILKAQNEGKERIAELCEALKQAEIEESLKESSTMIHVLSPIEGITKMRLALC